MSGVDEGGPSVSDDDVDHATETRVSLIAVDLDGTLLRSDGTLAPEGGRTLRVAARQGIHVILTTTRNLSSVRRFAAEIGIAHPVVCTNGAHILASPTGPTWVYRPIPTPLATALVEEGDRRDWDLITTVSGAAGRGEITVYRQHEGRDLGWMEPDRLLVARNEEALALGDATRILNYQPAAIPAIIDYMKTHFPGAYHLETYRYQDGAVKSIGIFALGCDKGTGVREVADRLEVGPEAVMAIGDNPNDLPMFRWATLRVAMGNATREVRQAATVVAPTNDEEGVAWAVARYVLGEPG